MSDIHYTSKQVPWVFVVSHYDFHISGLAEYQGVLHWAQLVGDWSHYTYEDRDAELLYAMEPLTGWQAFRWRLRKKAFEIFVGRHWSTPTGPINPSARMQKFYYKVLKKVL